MRANRSFERDLDPTPMEITDQTISLTGTFDGYTLDEVIKTLQEIRDKHPNAGKSLIVEEVGGDGYVPIDHYLVIRRMETEEDVKARINNSLFFTANTVGYKKNDLKRAQEILESMKRNPKTTLGALEAQKNEIQKLAGEIQQYDAVLRAHNYGVHEGQNGQVQDAGTG